jgi:hypothetical protein
VVTAERKEMKISCLLKTNESTRHLFKDNARGVYWFPTSPITGDMGHPSCRKGCVAKSSCGTTGVVSHVSNRGRHGAPIVVVKPAAKTT